MKLTKLDAYDYDVHPGIIRIKLMSTTDPDLVDIMSEIYRSRGNIYVEGCHYSYLDNYRLLTEGGDAFLELDVVQTA